MTGIELTPTAPGPALRNGQIIAAQDDSSDVSAVSVLRDIGSISSTLTGSEVTAMINRLDEVVTQISPLMRSGFDLFALAHQHQQMPFAQMLRIADDTLRGAAALSDPFVNLFTTLVEKTAMYADPQETAKVTGALTGLVQTFITLGQVVGTDPGDLATVLDASLTLGPARLHPVHRARSSRRCTRADRPARQDAAARGRHRAVTPRAHAGVVARDHLGLAGRRCRPYRGWRPMNRVRPTATAGFVLFVVAMLLAGW